MKIGPFTISRTPKFIPREGDGRSHGDWKPGELAVCIADDGGWRDLATGIPSRSPPHKGTIYRVCAVTMSRGFHSLKFEELADWWTAKSFRKIVRAEDGPCEEEFVTLLRKMKPRVKA